MTLGLTAQDSNNRKGKRSGGGDRQKPKVSGVVLDSNTEEPLPYSSISIFSKKDSSLIGGGLTDDDGKFSIEVRPGPSYAIIEYISYEATTIETIPLEKGKKRVDLGVIYLSTDSYTLSQVEIRAEKSETQFSLDKKVFNVGQDLANKGGSADEVLDNVPSVAVDIDGNVSLRGSGNVRILIDGRPSGLVSVDNANGLRQLPANMIDKVEVITNPSAKYEAEGMAGIINIVLKKDKKKGYNSVIGVNLGTPTEYGMSYTGNYRNGATNFFATYGINKRTGPGGGTRLQERIIGDSIFYSDQFRDINRNSLSHNFSGGMDYSISENQTLTGSITYRISNDDNFTLLNYEDYTGLNNRSDRELSLFTARTDIEKENENRLDYSLLYTNRLDDSGKELTATIQYRDETENENSIFEESFFSAINVPSGIPPLNQRSGNTESQKNILFQLDYINPIGEEGKYEIGLRANLRGIDNNYLVEEFVNNEIWENIDDLSNNFNYDEDVYAAYAIYGNKKNKLSYQVGLRLEHSEVLTELEQTNEVNDRSYTNLFPSAHFSYEFSTTNAFQISYSKRLRRPRFRDLNPFFTFSDSRNFFSGNPDLDPENTDSYEIGHLKYFENATLSSSVFWRHSNNVIQRIQLTGEDGNTITAPQNLNTRDDYGLDLNFSYSGIKWWRIDGNYSVFRQIVNGENVRADFSANGYTMNGRMTNKLTVAKDIDVQLRFNFRGPRNTTQGRYSGIYTMDLGVSKDFLNKKLNATLSARDLFNSRRRVWFIENGDYSENGDFQWRARTIRLNLSYKFSKGEDQKGKKGRRQSRGNSGFEGEGEF